MKSGDHKVENERGETSGGDEFAMPFLHQLWYCLVRVWDQASLLSYFIRTGWLTRIPLVVLAHAELHLRQAVPVHRDVHVCERCAPPTAPLTRC